MPRDYKRVLGGAAQRRRRAGRGAIVLSLDAASQVAQWVSPPGFIEIHAEEAADAAGRRARPRLARGLSAVPATALRGAGGALHGLRHSVLSSGLPARQPDSRLERSRLSRPLAARRSIGCTRPTTFRSSPAGSARRRAKARACSASTTSRSRSRRSRSSIIDRAFDEGWVVARPPARAHRQARRGRRLGPGRPRRRRSAEPRRPPRHGVRARRSHRRAAALRHSRVQAGEALPRSPARPDAAGRRRSSGRACNVGVDVPLDELRARVRRDRARRRRDAAARSAGARPRAEGHPLRDGVPAAAEPPLRRRRRFADDQFITAEGQARRHHRRRRHRRRLPRHGAPPGRASGASARAAAASAGRRARQTTRGRCGRTSSASRRRTKKAASGCTRSSTQRFTGDEHGRVTTLHAVQRRDRQRERPAVVRAGRRQRVRDQRRPRAAGDGIPRSRSATACSTSSACR